jgi:hypothetical protein
MQLIPLQNFIIKSCFIQFLWFFRLNSWFKGQIISRIHLSLPNAYKLMCFDRNINGYRDDKFFDWDYWSLHWPKKLTLLLIFYWVLILLLNWDVWYLKMIPCYLNFFYGNYHRNAKICTKLFFFLKYSLRELHTYYQCRKTKRNPTYNLVKI